MQRYDRLAQQNSSTWLSHLKIIDLKIDQQQDHREANLGESSAKTTNKTIEKVRKFLEP
jgi:hypothetical protein